MAGLIGFFLLTVYLIALFLTFLFMFIKPEGISKAAKTMTLKGWVKPVFIVMAFVPIFNLISMIIMIRKWNYLKHIR